MLSRGDIRGAEEGWYVKVGRPPCCGDVGLAKEALLGSVPTPELNISDSSVVFAAKHESVRAAAVTTITEHEKFNR